MEPDRGRRSLRWPPAPSFPADAFKGTAVDYAKYRPPYPERLLSDLLSRVGVCDHARLLDLGCGPGRVALALAPHFGQTCAVDPEQEMIQEGRRRTTEGLTGRVCWIRGSAEALVAEPGSFQLVTIGEAFHRMDQRVVATHVRRWLVPGGCIAILGYEHIWHGAEDWKRRVCEVLRGYQDCQSPDSSREAASQSAMTFQDVLRAAGYRRIESRDYRERRLWTADEVIGYLYSVSTYSKRRLGDQVASFERDVRQTLRDVDESGQYSELARFECLSATAPA